MWWLITPALHGAEYGSRCLSADYHASAGHRGCDSTKGFTDSHLTKPTSDGNLVIPNIQMRRQASRGERDLNVTLSILRPAL